MTNCAAFSLKTFSNPSHSIPNPLLSPYFPPIIVIPRVGAAFSRFAKLPRRCDAVDNPTAQMKIKPDVCTRNNWGSGRVGYPAKGSKPRDGQQFMAKCKSIFIVVCEIDWNFSGLALYIYPEKQGSII